MASAKDDKQFKYDAGNTLLALREKAGMTQPELAEKTGRTNDSKYRYRTRIQQLSTPKRMVCPTNHNRLIFPFTPVFRYGFSRQSVYGYRT